MATVVIMPRQGQSVESCVITSWNKKVGDKVSEGDVLFSYETDKSSFDEMSSVSGTVLAVLAEDGDEVECLAPVCVIGEEGEDISELLAEKKSEVNTDDISQSAGIPSTETETAKPEITVSLDNDTDRMKISPRARALAKKTDADLSRVSPTGPMGRIIERDINTALDLGYTNASACDDVAAVAEVVKSEDTEYTDVPLTNIRKIISKSMHASLSEMAQLTLNASFDASQLLAYRSMLKKNAQDLGLENITINDMILFAVAKTLPSHRDLNANYLSESGVMRYFTSVNLGIAVDTERGLMVPTLFGADKLTLNELSKRAKSIITDTQSGTVNPDLLKGGSFTVTNLGSLGIESFTPVINPPQTGILGVNTITQRVREKEGKIEVYPSMALSLTFDHRALDGAPAARFLKELCSNLENFQLLTAK